MAEFLLKIKDFEDAPKEYRLPATREWLGAQLDDTDLSPDPSAEEGSVELTASKSGEDVVLQGRVTAGILAPCARCLENVPLSLEADLTMLVVHASNVEPPEEGVDLTPEELAKETYRGDELELDEIVRENLILEVPMQVHCSTKECLARWEGSGEKASKLPDPRLAGLAALRDKVGPKKGS